MKKALGLLLVCVFFSGCVGIPKDALQLSPENLSNRQLQTRRFETTDFKTMLSAASAVLQDLGFSLDETEVALGVIVGSKQRDATSGLQMAGAIFAALLGVYTPVDKSQDIRVSMVMRELTVRDNGQRIPFGQSLVRVTFQRIIYTTDNQARVRELIHEPELYKEFFEKLSQAVFLEAHEI